MARPIRFVHAADLHLDAPFAGVDAAEGRVRQALKEATSTALDRVVELAVTEGVDFVVVAGDLYDSRDKSFSAQRAFQRAAVELSEHGIEVFVARGNHDPEDGWSAGLELPETVKHFPSDEVGRFEVVREGAVRCSVYGRSFATAAVMSDLSTGFAREGGDDVAIGVLHTNVGGRPGTEPYAPSTLDRLRSARMDYWALGHIHAAERLSEEPHIVYSGGTQGLDPTEPGAHGCFVVEASPEAISARFEATDSVRYVNTPLDVSGCDSAEDVRRTLSDACALARDEADGRAVIARFELVGRTSAHSELSREGVLAEVAEDVQSGQMTLEPWVWLDRVRDRTAAPLDLDRIRSGEDFLGDLVSLADELCAGDPASFVETATDSLRKHLLGLMPEPVDPAALVRRARDLCLDRFMEDGSQ